MTNATGTLHTTWSKAGVRSSTMVKTEVRQILMGATTCSSSHGSSHQNLQQPAQSEMLCTVPYCEGRWEPRALSSAPPEFSDTA